MKTAVKERRLLLNQHEAAAVQSAGRRTQIRRVVEPQPPVQIDGARVNDSGFIEWWCDHLSFSGTGGKRGPFGQPGNRLWCAETVAFWYKNGKPSNVLGYRADITGDMWNDFEFYEDPWWTECKWRSPVTMPRWACRTVIEVTAVRVEQVQSVWEWIGEVKKV